MSKECYLISNNFLQALSQVLCIKITIFFPKIHNHSKMWKTHPRRLKKIKLSRRKIQFVIYFKQQTHFLLIPKRQNNLNHLFPHYIKSNQIKTANPKTCQPIGSTVIWDHWQVSLNFDIKWMQQYFLLFMPHSSGYK